MFYEASKAAFPFKTLAQMSPQWDWRPPVVHRQDDLSSVKALLSSWHFLKLRLLRKGDKTKSGGRPESAGGNTQRGQLAAEVRGRSWQWRRQQWYWSERTEPPLCRHAPLKCELKSLIDGHSYWESGSRTESLNRDEGISTTSASPASVQAVCVGATKTNQ